MRIALDSSVLIAAHISRAGVCSEMLEDILLHHELVKDRASKRFDSVSDTVRVITLHSSKGLEFPIVAIIGLGFMPYIEAEAANEARLLYVGMTRATDELLMTASRDSAFAQKLLMIQKTA